MTNKQIIDKMAIIGGVKMKKIIYIFLLFFLLNISACGKKDEDTALNLLNWALLNIEIEDSLVRLPLKHPDHQEVFTWTLGEEAIIIENGIINLNGEYSVLNLIVGIKYKDTYKQLSTQVTVDSFDISLVQKKFINQFYSSVINQNYNIQTSFSDFGGTNVSWHTDKPELFSNEGIYNAPFYDETITIYYTIETALPKITKTYEKSFTVGKMKQSIRVASIKENLDRLFSSPHITNLDDELPLLIPSLDLTLTWYDQYGQEISKLADVRSYIIPNVGIDLTVKAFTKTDIVNFKYNLQTLESNESFSMRIVKSIELVKELTNGWNIGNTLDAPTETSWGNGLITKSLIDTVKEAGFKLIRIPVTWEGHFSNDPNYIIDEAYLDRIQEVVNYAIDENTYVILNMHHERWNSTTYANQARAAIIMEKLWTQISNRFANYNEHLLFEGMNEPRNYDGSESVQWSGNLESFNVINHLNQVFVATIRKAGGHHSYRHLLITTNGAGTADAILSSLIVPQDPYVIVSVHSYTPYDFAHDKTDITTWQINNASQTSLITNVFKRLNQYFISKDIAVIMGEFASRDKQNLSDRLAWLDYYLNIATSYNIPCIWWDSGQIKTVENMTFSILNRYTREWLFPEIVARLTKDK